MANKVLTQKDVRKAALYWHATSHMTYNYQRLQAGCMASMMGPIFDKLYPDNPEKIKEGLEREMLYFNTEPRWGAIIPGMTVALEEAYAVDPDSGIDGNTITEIKTALMGPLAGIGDTVWAGLMKPIFLSITLAWAMDGHVWLGTDSIERFLEGGFVKTVTTALGIIGLFCLGAMIVKYVTVDAVLVWETTSSTLDFGALINQIIPSFLPLVFTMFAYWLQVKGKKVTTVLLALFIIGFVGGAVGFLG